MEHWDGEHARHERLNKLNCRFEGWIDEGGARRVMGDNDERNRSTEESVWSKGV